MTVTGTAGSDTSRPRLYRRSVLVSAASKWRRGATVTIVTVLINAVLQAILVRGHTIFGFVSTTELVILGLLSFVVLLLCGSVVISAALIACVEPVTRPAAIKQARSHFWLFTIWVIVWILIVGAGLIVYSIPGLVLAALLPFVSIAAMDGQRNAVVANFRAIGNRFGRYLLTLAVTGVLMLGVFLIAVINEVFVTGWLASLIAWILFGIFASWLFLGWSLLYRSTTVGQLPPVAADLPS